MEHVTIRTGHQATSRLVEFHPLSQPIARRPRGLELFKRSFDLLFVLMALPLVAMLAALLLALNPIFNPGPMFYRQERMGREGKRFMIWKFRTMFAADGTVRAHDAPVEQERITRLGRFLRQSRLDELPNLVNVLRGEMSVIGPRPDAWEHAVNYLGLIPHYRLRFHVRPGITGLAQVRGGYADSIRAVERKARYDGFYVRQCGIALEIYIILETVRVVLTGFGAK